MCVSTDGTDPDLLSGSTGIDLLGANLLNGVPATVPATSVLNNEGSEFESAKVSIRNNSEMKFGAPSTGGQQWASWYREMLYELEMDFTLFPSTIDTILWDLGPEVTQYVDYNTILVNGELGAEILYQRGVNDFVRLRLKKTVVESATESLEAIDSGVDPMTIVMKFGEQDSTLSAYAEDPLAHVNVPYSYVP